MSAPGAPVAFRARGRELLFGAPQLMGVVNATKNSFSDAGRFPTLESRLDHAEALLADGAHIIDVGGQSAVTITGETPPDEEIENVVPVVEGLLARHPDLVISIDTYKPPVAEAALAAGALVINDTSGLRYPELADVVASYDAGLVVMHNVGRPKERLTDASLYADLVPEVVAFIEDRISVALAAGVGERSIIVDPGPDFSKTPFQTIRLLQEIDAFCALGHPVLLAISRKDFIGAVTGQPPGGRLAGTLASIGFLADHPGMILRVHDVREVRDYLHVRAVLRGEATVPEDLELAPHLRRVAPPTG